MMIKTICIPRVTRTSFLRQDLLRFTFQGQNQCASFNTKGRSELLIFNHIPRLREFRRDVLLKGETIGLVPTMGALHAGHIELMRGAAVENDHVIVSIFVNPTQFGPKEDLVSYPRTLDSDVRQIRELNKELKSQDGLGAVSAVFAPNVETMYPSGLPSSEVDGDGSFVTITPLARKLEGTTRPVFFRGVATVCTKLFNIVQAERVYFGQKDVQQTVVIRRMVKDFHMPTEVRVLPTSREEDGLAMSSRNIHLGLRRRKAATILYEALKAAENAYAEHSVLKVASLYQEINNALDRFQETHSLLPKEEQSRWELDYISITDMAEMDEIKDDVDPMAGFIISGAVKFLPVDNPQNDLEKTQISVRLIDNIVVPPLYPPKSSKS